MVKAKKATKVKTAAKAATTYTLNMANGSSKVVTRKRRIPTLTPSMIYPNITYI